MTETVGKIVAEALTQNNDILKETLSTNKDAIINALGPLKKHVEDLTAKYDTVQSSLDQQGKDITALTSVVNNMKDTVKAELAKDTELAVVKSNLASFHYNLSVENNKANCNAIIHGLAGANPKEEVATLISNMNIPPTSPVNVVSVVVLVQGKEGKKPSVMVTLQNAFQHNDLLKHSKNIPKKSLLIKIFRAHIEQHTKT